MRQDHRYLWLDFIRGMAAVAVCGSHLRNAMFVDYSTLLTATWAQKAFYVMTGGVAHQAVMVFFVLSGCFVGGAVLHHRDSFDPMRYAVARLTRLWVVLIPALVFTAAVDSVTGVVAPDVIAGLFKPTWHSGPSNLAPCSSTWATFVANVFFLQTIVAPVFGTNGPLWTLAYEFWYYVLFPMVFVALYGKVKGVPLPLPGRILLGAATLALALWLPLPLVEGSLVWAMGVLVAVVRGRLSARANAGVLAGGTVALLAALAYGRFPALEQRTGVPAYLLVGAACGLLVIGIVNRPPRLVGPGLWERASIRLSDVSFSLYLVHFPVVALIGGVVYPHGKLPLTAANVATFGLWLGLLLVIGHVFYLCFERHTEAVRRWVNQMLRVPIRTV